MSSLSADFTTPFSKIGPQYLHPSHRITGGGLLPTTPTMRARTSPPTESPQHQFSADSSRFPKAPPVSADWGILLMDSSTGFILLDSLAGFFVRWIFMKSE